MHDLQFKLEKRRSEKYQKIRKRFLKNLRSGGFALKTSREKRRTIETLKQLERKLGIAMPVKLKHWALAAALGFVTLTTHAGDGKTYRLFQRQSIDAAKLQMVHQKATVGPMTKAAGEAFSFEFSEVGDGMMITHELTDIDGDGDTDILGFDYYSGFRVFKNDGNGNFTKASQGAGSDNLLQDVYVGDFDSDGDTDFILATYAYTDDADRYHFYENDGTGSFSNTELTLPANFYDSATTLDVNNDGNLDFIARVADEGSGEITTALFLNDGSLNFTLDDLGFDIPDIAIGYFNNDALPDIAYYTSYAYQGLSNMDSVYIYLNEASSFIEANRIPATVTGFSFSNEATPQAIDVNNDDIDDLVFAIEDYVADHDSLFILHNNGSGTFNSATLIETPEAEVEDIVVADIDSDGDDDLAIYLYTEYYDVVSENYIWDSHLNFYLQDGTGDFVLHEISNDDEIMNFAANISFNDIDADGDQDLIVNNYFFGINSWANDGSENFTTFQEKINDPLFSFRGVVGDMDADGDPDVITAPLGLLLLNDGNAGFEVAANLFKEHGLASYYAATADMDEDGETDLVIYSSDYTGYSGNQFIQVWSYDASTLTKKSEKLMDPGLEFDGIALADVDNDGDTDAVVLYRNEYEANFGTMLNDGAGNLGNIIPQRQLQTSYFADIQLQDLNNDARPDAVFTDGDSLFIMGNDGAGNFSNMGGFDLGSIDSEGNGFSIGDIDSDGDPDIVMAMGYGNDRIFINNGNGNFSLDARSIESNYSYTNVLADVDNDGDLDLIVSQYGSHNVLFKNDGAGNFTQAAVLSEAITLYSLSLLTGDFDSDGDVDIYQPTAYSADHLWLNDLIVEGVNSLPTDITLSDNTISEDAEVNAMVGTFETTDPNVSDQHTYSLVAGNGTNDADNANFFIDDNILRLNTTLDYDAQSVHNIYVQTDDGNGGTFTKAFTIMVEEVDALTDRDLSSEVLIYPNPSEGLVSIKADYIYTSLQVYSPDGRLVYEADFEGFAKITLSKGIYIIKLKGDYTEVDKKLIVQ